MSERLLFRSIELKDKELLNSYLKKESGFLADHNFGNLYMWRFKYCTEFAVYNDYLYIKMMSPESDVHFYFLPFGKKEGYKEALRILIDEGKRDPDGKMWFCSSSSWQKELADSAFDGFNLIPSRDFADYIYTSESLIELKGKKLHRKKNHLNRFIKDNEGKWIYEDLDEYNAEEFYSFQLRWADMHGSENFEDETLAVKILLDNRRELNVKGGLIRLEGQVIAMTLGTEFSKDVFDVNIEKALPDINGAYQIINNEFAKRNLSSYKYINREEDMGIDGLRQAKLSYCPEFLGDAYEGWYC